jgi:hypothetical protein
VRADATRPANSERLVDYIDCQVLNARHTLILEYMDGNGRTGRAMWAWQMHGLGHDPFALPFLRRFYYQTLEASR